MIDARLKIIQKNRQRLTDARDKLSELAKQTDARAKIKGRSQQMVSCLCKLKKKIIYDKLITYIYIFFFQK